MANVGDDVLSNILGRVPGKPLLRFRCVSKHWNRVISDPLFMKTRSRQMILILFSFPRPLLVIDDNVEAEDEAPSIVTINPSPVQKYMREVSIIGTFNGIVLLALTDYHSLRCELILYNPLTCASKTLAAMDRPNSISRRFMLPAYVFGFDGDGLKIVRFELISCTEQNLYRFDVFDLKTSSWSSPQQYMEWDFFLWDTAGVFLNGFLYWPTFRYRSVILALNVKDMVFSKIKLPDGLQHGKRLSGSKDGCLCLIDNVYIEARFDVWLMKDSWMKTHSFKATLDLGRGSFCTLYAICILGNGKILMKNDVNLLVIYDMSKVSYKVIFDSLKTLDDLNRIGVKSAFMEYVESLVSPSHLCFI